MAALRILQIGGLSDGFNQQLTGLGEVCQLWQQEAELEFLAVNGADFELVVTSARFGCSPAQLALLPNLRAICSFGVGYDAIAIDLVRQRGIQLSNTPDVLNDCVADLAMGLIIACARHIALGDSFVRRGEWGLAPFPLGRKVSGKRLGIVGLGRIGKQVVRRSSGFGMEVRYHNRTSDPASEHPYMADLAELARWADFLVLTCIGGPSTHHLVGRPVLEALGEQGILINVARGSVVDELALIHALQTGKLGGAGLDVHEAEPRVRAALLELPNVVVLPHIASATEETRRDMEQLVLANVQAFFSRGELLTPV